MSGRNPRFNWSCELVGGAPPLTINKRLLRITTGWQPTPTTPTPPSRGGGVHA